ncbi:hypothetical protein HYDPIDRAFT_171439 [Hydnomerulius pinastri MD-312]|uniref:Uncharacterized protein n=1 Tax=Hydnomerulius pinastri MD-312 TaxID=994086 RepID=A0A0C9VXG7_9AGAM|nr:hypothetical protein HYDPIDRAFT_171439 [Hydnomerulius pinastri MD-312]
MDLPAAVRTPVAAVLALRVKGQEMFAYVATSAASTSSSDRGNGPTQNAVEGTFRTGLTVKIPPLQRPEHPKDHVATPESYHAPGEDSGPQNVKPVQDVDAKFLVFYHLLAGSLEALTRQENSKRNTSMTPSPLDNLPPRLRSLSPLKRRRLSTELGPVKRSRL